MCLEATGVGFEWEEVIAGSSAIEKFGTPLPEYVLKSVRKNKVAIKGPIITPVGKGFPLGECGLAPGTWPLCLPAPGKEHPRSPDAVF